MSDCIPTPYAKVNGYGRMRIAGKNILHHRYVYVTAHKLKLEDIAGMSVMHTCDNPGCVNPTHLLLGTHTDNMQDAVVKNRKPKGAAVNTAVLTAEKVLEIRADLRSAYKDIALKYGISVPTVKDIKSKRSWKHI